MGIRSLAVTGILLAVTGAMLACSLAARLFDGDAPAPPQASPERLIAYAGSDGNIYTIDRQGGSRTAITDDANLSLSPGSTGRIYQYPTWAPDGEHFAFVELSASSQTDLQARLLSTSTGSKELVEAFSSDAYQPFYLYWSPDSRKISFLSNDTQGEGLILHLAAADGSGSQIAGTGQPYYWDWSPEGDEVFIHTGGAASNNPAARLAFITMDDPFPSRGIDLSPASFQAPAWSPDGGAIVVAGDSGEGEAIILYERSSGAQHTIAKIDGPASFAWSPDGRRLAYVAPGIDESGSATRELHLAAASRLSESRRLAAGLIVGFFWAPDGRHLALFKPALPGQGDNTLMAFQEPASFSLDLQVIDVDSGETRHLATIVPTEAFLNLLPFYDQYQRSMTLWSPDSRELVISALDEQSQPGIYVIDVVSGESSRIADGDLAFWGP